MSPDALLRCTVSVPSRCIRAGSSAARASVSGHLPATVAAAAVAAVLGRQLGGRGRRPGERSPPPRGLPSAARGVGPPTPSARRASVEARVFLGRDALFLGRHRLVARVGEAAQLASRGRAPPSPRRAPAAAPPRPSRLRRRARGATCSRSASRRPSDAWSPWERSRSASLLAEPPSLGLAQLALEVVGRAARGWSSARAPLLRLAVGRLSPRLAQQLSFGRRRAPAGRLVLRRLGGAARAAELAHQLLDLALGTARLCSSAVRAGGGRAGRSASPDTASPAPDRRRQ